MYGGADMKRAIPCGVLVVEAAMVGCSVVAKSETASLWVELDSDEMAIGAFEVGAVEGDFDVVVIGDVEAVVVDFVVDIVVVVNKLASVVNVEDTVSVVGISGVTSSTLGTLVIVSEDRKSWSRGTAVAEGDVVGLEAGVVAAVVVIASLMVEGSAEETFVAGLAKKTLFWKKPILAG